MLNLLQIIIFLLLCLIIFYNFFLKSQQLFFSIYPYLSANIFLGAFILITINFSQNQIIIFSLEIILITLLLFSCYALLQADKNLTKKSDYQLKSLEYKNLLNWEQSNKVKASQDERARLIQKLSSNPLTYNNQLELLFKEEEIFAEIFRLLEAAKEHIHLQFYIIRDDKLGEKLKDLLIAKVKSGVEVRIIYDAIGSKALSKKYKQSLKQSGVKVGVYNNLLKSLSKGKLNNRLHRKLIITDGKQGFVSDLNIGTEYIGENSRESVGFKLEGQVIRYLQKIFLNDWYYIKGEKITSKKYFPTFKEEGKVKLQVINSSYDSKWNKIEQTYQALIAGAKEKIYLVTPYITLSDNLISTLQLAALRGVEVKIILAKKTNNFLIDWANKSRFSDLIKADIKLYYYDKEFLHTKTLIIDQQIMTFGSANFNNRSLYLDYETNIVVFDQEKTQEMIAKVESYLTDSYQVSRKNYLKPTIKIKLQNAIGDLFAPFA